MAVDPGLSHSDLGRDERLAAWQAAGLFIREEHGHWVVVDGPGWQSRARVLAAVAEAPSPWPWAWRVRQVVSTTMTVARRELDRRPGPVAVLADRQTKGRGRRGRRWESSAGAGLHLSLAWPPGPELVAAGALTLRVGVAAARAVERVTEVRLGLKWPNDGLHQGQKVMGILCEGGTYPTPWVVAGIGMNINGLPPAGIEGATSLAAITGRPWSRARLAAAIAAETAAVLESRDDSWFGEYQDRSRGVTLGRRVRVMGAGTREYQGQAESVDATGALWVRRDDGTLVPVTAGEVSIRTPGGGP
jgi:BirA family biotin operon repressor/biotin-[acetyl-CoA-carboxylase] ligase